MLRLLLQVVLNLLLIVLAAFFGLLGHVLLPGAWQELQVARASHAWKPVPAVIVAAEAREVGRLWCARLEYEYHLAGERYRSDREQFGVLCSRGRRPAEAKVAKFRVGTSVTAYVDASNPARAVLRRGAGQGTRAGVGAGVFLLLSAVAMLYLLIPFNQSYWRGLLAERDRILGERARALQTQAPAPEGEALPTKDGTDGEEPFSPPHAPPPAPAPEALLQRIDQRLSGWILIALLMFLLGSCAALEYATTKASAERRARFWQDLQGASDREVRTAPASRPARQGEISSPAVAPPIP